MSSLRVLAWDIETRPLDVYTFGLFDQNIGLTQLKTPVSVLSFAARWVGEPKNSITFKSVYEPSETGDTYAQTPDAYWDMLHTAHDLIDEADALLSWNGKNFDTKHMNREFLQAGMSPPSPIREIDLLQTARAKFRFTSNKLDHVSQLLGVGAKSHHEGFGLWLKCLQGDPKAWARMERYNKQDVHLLIDLYDKFLPWISNHPNQLLYNTGAGCPRCAATDEHMTKQGRRPTQLGLYQRYQCNACGGWSTSGKALERVDTRGE